MTGSKYDRALPVSQAYERGAVRHAGMFRELEDEMCAFGADMGAGASPDRLDALVWAIRELTRRSRGRGCLCEGRIPFVRAMI